jgi:hypothetical protein
MKHNDYLGYIIEKMSLLNENIRLNNKQSLYNLNIISENFYRDLLNIVFDDKLINNNFFEQNSAVFDLISDKHNKVYQITSRNDKEKIDETIDAFNNSEKKLYEKYDLYFVIIGKKVSGQKIQKIINNKKFDTNKILDTNDLISTIENAEIDKIKDVYDFIRKYFDNKLFDIDIKFFKDKLYDNIENLGERYNKTINIFTPINDVLSHFFINSENKTQYLNQVKMSLDRIGLKTDIINNYEKQFIKFKKDLFKNDYTNIITFLNDIMKNLYNRLDTLKTNYEKNYYTITNINKELQNLINYLEVFELANRSVFILTGKTGMGKTHTVTAYLKNEFIDKDKYGFLVLGQHINERKSIESQIMENLQLNMSFDELLFSLNEYGIKNSLTVPIIIDGINEGLEPYNWKKYVNGLVNKVSRYKFVKILISIRNEYLDFCLPTDLFNNSLVYVKEHQGFKDNFINIMNRIFDCYDLAMPVFPIIDSNFSNPLFVFTFCKMAKKLNKNPVIEEYQDFTKVYFEYIEHVSKRLADHFHYEKDDKILEDVINGFIEYILEKKINYISKKELLAIIENYTRGFNITPNDYIIAIKSEGLIYKDSIYIKNDKGKYDYIDVIRFSFERYQKIMTAKYLLDNYSDIEILKNDISKKIKIGEIISTDNNYIDFGLLQELFICIQNEFKREIYEIVDFSSLPQYYKSRFIDAYIESLIWRKEIYDSKDLKKFKEFANEYIVKDEEEFNNFLKLLIKVSFIKGHPLNADFLHSWLEKLPLGERDYIWTVTIQNLYVYDDEIFEMLLEQCMIQGNRNLDDDTTLLLGQLLGWFCTSSNRHFRDRSTKAMVSILENRIYLFNRLIEKFINIDDMYVLERVLAACYGAILRSDNINKLNLFCSYIYSSFFNNKPLNPNILIRYYCKSIVEYSAGKIKLDFDIKDIYNNIKNEWYDYIPTLQEIDEKYMHDYNDKNFKKHYFAQNAIINSMITEYGRGTGGYGDFGRYVFEGLVRYWEYQFKDSQILANIVIKNVFDMGYDVELHGHYDISIRGYNRHDHNPERIGKKYQWIATYELIGKLCDNFDLIYDVYSDTIIDTSKYTYLDKNYKKTKDKNKIHYYVTNEYNIGDSYVKNIDPTLFIQEQEKNPIKFYSDDNNWINEEIDITKIIQKNINGVDYFSLSSLEDWVNDEQIADFHHPFKKRVAIKSMLFITENVDKYLKNTSKCLSDIYWQTYFHVYIKEFNNSKYYFNEIAPNEYDIETNLLFTSTGYCCESSGYDQSIKETINILVPSYFIINGLDLIQKNDYCWYDRNDNLICFDNGIFNGNNNLLINKDIFLEFVKRKNLSFVWGVFYEKTTRNWLNNWRKNVSLCSNGSFKEITIEKDGWDISKV